MDNWPGVRIDPRAEVEEGSEIGTGTSVWHFSHVRSGSNIGENCVVGKGVYIDTGVRIGDNCKLQNGAMVYKGVVIEDGVFVGPHVVFTNDMRPRSHLWDEERLESTLVRDGASIGANSTIRCGISLGRWSMIAAGSVVTKDVPDYALVMGCPARIVDWVTPDGERLGIDLEQGLEGGEFVHEESGEVVKLTRML